MRTVADPNAAFVSIPDIAGPPFVSAALSKLISVAAATLDSDRATARACIERAAELLGVTDEVRPVPVTSNRGGLAPWQLRRIEAILRRWSDEGETVLPDDAPAFYRVSVRCGFKSPEKFQDALAKWRRAIREVYRKAFSL